MRMIDADVLEKELLKKAQEYTVSMFSTESECYIARIVALECAKEVKNAPTIVAEPVRHGEWIEDRSYHADGCLCSMCGDWELRRSKHCPECGARMDGGAKHD